MKDAYYYYDQEKHHLTTISAFPQAKDDAGRDYMLITGIQTSRQGRGQGFAKRLLNELLADADKEQVILMLSVDPDPDVDRDRLVKWYESVGFKFVHEGDPSMKRFPVSQTFMLDPKTGWKLSEHLELHHALNTQLLNVREMQSKHKKDHLIQRALPHTHSKPTRQEGK